MKKVLKVKFCWDKTWPCVLKTKSLKDQNKKFTQPFLRPNYFMSIAKLFAAMVVV